MTLETPRLSLAPWRAEDWPLLQPIATHAEVMRFITGGIPWTEDQIRAFAATQEELFATRGFCRWKITEKSTGECIGFCGPGFWRDLPVPEIGWWLALDRWGLGLAPEAARTALGDAFDRVGLPRLISVARQGNTASTRIMAKLGMHLEEQFERDGVAMVRYGIAREAASGVVQSRA